MKLSIEELKESRRSLTINSNDLADVLDELIAIREAQGVPVDSDSFSWTQAECEQWKAASIEANRKVASYGDENRKLRAEIAKIKGSSMSAGFVDGWEKESGKPFQYKVTSTQNLKDGTELFTAPQLPVVPEGWHFERCEHDDCTNGAIVNVGSSSADNIHLCAECSNRPPYKNLKVKALTKRLSAAPKPGGE